MPIPLSLRERVALPAPMPAGDQRFVVHGVSWKDYVVLREALEIPGLRMAFDRGALELMSPSRKHERYKTMIGRLLEVWALERDVAVAGYGQTTFRNELAEQGVEPDECYTVGATMRDGEAPHLAIEVVLSSGGLDRLRIYENLGVREVWFFVEDQFRVFELGKGGYAERKGSGLLRGLDLDAIAAFAQREDQHAAVREFQASLRKPRRSAPKRRR